MPLTITPNGFILRVWDEETKEVTVTTGVSGFEHLNEWVDVQPNTTVGDMFDLVARDDRLCDFLRYYTFSDPKGLQARPRIPVQPLMMQVGQLIDGEMKEGTRSVEAKLLDMDKRVYVGRSGKTNQWEFSLSIDVNVRPERGALAANEFTSFHAFQYSGNASLPDHLFAAVCDLKLVLDDRAVLEIPDDESTEPSGPVMNIEDVPPIPDAECDWTLFEVLTELYIRFGKRPTSPYRLSDIEDFQRQTERARRIIKGLPIDEDLIE